MPRGTVLAAHPDERWPPVLWYAASMMHQAGLEVVDDPGVEGDPLIVVAVGQRSAEVAHLPGMFIAPDLANTEVSVSLADNPGPLLLVGSLGFPGWSQAAAARMRRAEVLQLPQVDRHLDVPGDVEGSLSALSRVLGRFRAVLERALEPV